MLILRALSLNYQRTKTLLKPDQDTITKRGQVWPSLTPEEWQDVEVALKNLILADYEKKNNVDAQQLTQAEIRDIILGQEIQAPSQQQQQMEEIEKRASDQAQIASTVTKTVDKTGEEIVVSTSTNYEQQTYSSRSSWRVRAISASNLHLRTQHIYVSTNDIKEAGYTFVLPRNILKKFVTIAELRTQVAVLMYGKHPADNNSVFEVRCFVVPPQFGSHQKVKFPTTVPEHPYLKDLQPLGWLHTQPNEETHLPPQDVVMHARLLQGNPSWDVDACSIVTCSFTPGSVSLAGYRLTRGGLDWGVKVAKETGSNDAIVSKGYMPSHYEKVQMHLSDRFMGFFMVPDENGIWNYNFSGANFNENMEYELALANPKHYYHEVHRPGHFLSFEAEERGGATVDDEDLFS